MLSIKSEAICRIWENGKSAVPQLPVVPVLAAASLGLCFKLCILVIIRRISCIRDYTRVPNRCFRPKLRDDSALQGSNEENDRPFVNSYSAFESLSRATGRTEIDSLLATRFKLGEPKNTLNAESRLNYLRVTISTILEYPSETPTPRLHHHLRRLQSTNSIWRKTLLVSL
jgi:hypothetical protein